MFSIIIPTFNNLNFLKVCLSSLKKNSSLNNEIIIHSNSNEDGTLDFIKENNFKYTHTNSNIGLCSAVNLAAKKVTTNYILYAHDDMYFLPEWDLALKQEVKNIGHNFFYLHAAEIGINGAHIKFDCGSNYENFDEKKLLNNYKNFYLEDYNANHLSPHLIHRDLWNKVLGFSEEFNPGDGSDPDLVLKLWNEGVRYFKCLGNFKVYHFGSVTTRKKKSLKLNKGTNIFIKKWGLSPLIIRKYYLETGKKFEIRNLIKKDFFYYYCLVKLKLKKIFIN
ncbi:WcaA Glycosyltransferases involved in cell wall biogenesis [Candidatus Pelagibacterales bacterium]|jgi:GT2 family glycosyltransferase